MADEPKLDTTPNDPSPYIRTMAKDVALLTGKGVPASITSKKDAPEPGVLLPQVDESQVAYKDAIPKEFTQEVLETSKEDEKEVFVQKPQGASVFSSIPHAPIAVTPSVPQPTQAERESILDRLRARVSTPASEPATSGPTLQSLMSQATGTTPGLPPLSKEFPAQPPAEPEQVYVPAPAAAQPPPPLQPVERPIPPPPPPPQPAANIPEPTNLHTYKTDFADRIDQKQATTFSVLAAAGDAGQPMAAPAAKRSLVPILGGVALVVAGVGLGLGAFYYVTHRPEAAKVAQVPSLVIPDETIELSGTGGDMYSRIASLANEASVDGNVYVTYVSTTTITKQGDAEKVPLPGGHVIAQLPLHAPTILLRNLDPLSTVGVIDTGPETRAFFVLRVTSYERSFAGMLAWEATIAEDLGTLYPEIPVSAPQPAATTTATTTPAAQPAPTAASVATTQPRFVDQVVANHDVRALRDGQNRTILLYGYRDKSTLIIARNEDAFTALITRLTASTQ